MLGFIAPALVRIAAAGVIIYGGYTLWQNRGTSQAAAVLAFAHFVIGAMLLFGYYVQYAALAGVIGIGISLIIPSLFPAKRLSRTTSILLLAICASLLLSGAGAFAFDLPL